MKAYEKTLNLLTSLKLKGILKSLDEIVTDAEIRKDSYISFLNNIFNAEIEERARRRFERNMSAAHFPVIKKADSFNFGRIKGICKSETVYITAKRIFLSHLVLLPLKKAIQFVLKE